MFNVGFQEMMVILVIALLIFGPKKLPEIGRSIGKTIREFKRASEEVSRSLDEPLDDLRDRDYFR
ncbi:MAG: TatA/E family twin arginine-targeting protein translocase [Fimbriimonadia bacterium]|nr:TatA/E family twin arginine-targeting protein translocase [Fimbriimonadia bacterium]